MFDFKNTKQNKSGNYSGECKICGRSFIGEKHDWLCDDCKDAQSKLTRKEKCAQIEYGSYNCYETTYFDACVDRCLKTEIEYLNKIGIKTIGCCCGHGKDIGFIQVDLDSCDKMINCGYEVRPIEDNGHGQQCFIPKSELWWQD